MAKVSGDATEVINRAASSLKMYAEYWGSSTKEFGEQLDLIVEILKAKSQRMDSPFDAALVRAYADALVAQIRPNG